jgi:hypothetical protein
VTFFILNSNRVNSVQTEWLKKVLPASTAMWKIVVFHHPAWTCGGYRSNTAIVQTWVPLFERYGVQLVLNGHDHNYQRFAPRRPLHRPWRRRPTPLSDRALPGLLPRPEVRPRRTRLPLPAGDRHPAPRLLAHAAPERHRQRRHIPVGGIH